MGKNTDALVDTCSKLALALDPLAKKIAGEIKQINERTATLKKTAVPRQGEKLLRKSDAAKWQIELKEIKSDRNVLAKDLGLLQNSALRNATKAAKDLESKIKKKDFLNFFKTQQSLDNAKKALKQSQQAIDKAEEQLTKFSRLYASLDEDCDEMTDHLKKSLKEGLEEDGRQLRRGRNTVDPLVQEWTDKFERYLTKTNPNAVVMLKNFPAVFAKKAELFKKLSSQIGKTKTWTEDTRKPLVKQIGDEIETIDKLRTNMSGLLGLATWRWDESTKMPRAISSLPAIRQLSKQVQTAEASVVPPGDILSKKLEMLGTDFGNLLKDLEAAGNNRDEENIGIIKARESFTLGRFQLEEMIDSFKESDIDRCKEQLSFVLALEKKRTPVTDQEWNKLRKIIAHLPDEKRQNLLTLGRNERFNSQLEATANRFKKMTIIQSDYKDWKSAYKKSMKIGETVVKLDEELAKRASKLMEKTLSSK